MESVPCQTSTDEFGRVSEITYTVNCIETRNIPKYVEFKDKKSAIEFYEKAKAQVDKDTSFIKSLNYSGEVNNVRMDSISNDR